MDLKLDFKPIKTWRTDILRDSPEIICISRPYIEQVLYRNQYSKDKDSLILFDRWSDHHHSHYAPEIEPTITPEINDLDKKDCYFELKSTIRQRRENDGCIIAQKHSVYYINSPGMNLIKVFSKPFKYTDLEDLSSKLDITKERSEDFFRKLLIFNLLEWTQ